METTRLGRRDLVFEVAVLDLNVSKRNMSAVALSKGDPNQITLVYLDKHFPVVNHKI